MRLLQPAFLLRPTSEQLRDSCRWMATMTWLATIRRACSRASRSVLAPIFYFTPGLADTLLFWLRSWSAAGDVLLGSGVHVSGSGSTLAIAADSDGSGSGSLTFASTSNITVASSTYSQISLKYSDVSWSSGFLLQRPTPTSFSTRALHRSRRLEDRDRSAVPSCKW